MKRRVEKMCATFALLCWCAPALAEGLEAGGLKPPAPVQGAEAAPPATPTEAQLDRADKEDSGRGLEFVWLNAEAGPEYLGLQTFKANQLVDSKLVGSTQTGMVYGAGLGVRLLVFTLGARFRLGDFSAWNLWTLNAEAGLHVPLGRVEPYLTLGGGYASLGAFSASNLGGAGSVNGAKGFDARAGFGLDFYLTNTFTVGGNLTADVLFLSRSGNAQASATPGVGTPEQQAAAQVYAKDGSSIGAGATLSAVLGLHF